MLTLNRPAYIVDGAEALDAEYRAARWAHHRLLDFEDRHEALIRETAELVAPGIGRVSRIIAKLLRRKSRRKHSTGWTPDPRSELLELMKRRLSELRSRRDTDPRWKDALKWGDRPGDGAPPRGKARRRKGDSESEEAFAERCAQRRCLLTRREAHAADVYRQRRCYWGTWNAITESVKQSRKAVLAARKSGMPARWRRPRWDGDATIAADAGKKPGETGGFRIVERGTLWWVIDIRIGARDVRGEWRPGDYVRIRAKCGNWHPIDSLALLRTAKLTRRKNGNGWSYSVSITVDMEKPELPGSGTVGLDWGHREHGHDLEREGIRAFVWHGSDGKSGEILVPAECRVLLDEVDDMKARMDAIYAARNEPERNRYAYRSRLMRSGARTLDESRWLAWETRYERRISSARDRVANLRESAYIEAIRDLRQRYRFFGIENLPGKNMQKLDTEGETSRRKRSNRDLVARYLFVTLCERFGAELIPVPARNTSRTCSCGAISKIDAGVLQACPQCGKVRDRDYGAAEEIWRRAVRALENRAANTQNDREVA